MDVSKFLLVSAELRAVNLLICVFLKVLSKGILLKVVDIPTLINNQLTVLEETFWTKPTVAL